MREKKTRSFTFRTSDEVMEELERLAKQEDRTLGWLADRALRDWLAWHRQHSYDAPALAGESADVVRFWARLTASQRKIMLEMLRSGALEVREDPHPVFNERKGT